MHYMSMSVIQHLSSRMSAMCPDGCTQQVHFRSEHIQITLAEQERLTSGLHHQDWRG